MQDIKFVFSVVFLLFLVAVSLTACSDGELDIKTVSESQEVISTEQMVASPNESEQKVFSTKKEEHPVDNSDDEKADVSKVCVYICGAVVNEGVYELDSSSRKKDVLEMAGGYSESAAHGVVNLAEIVTDGEKIYIPTVEDVETGTYDKMMNPSDNIGGSQGSSESGTNNISSNGLVNINTASKEALMTLPGIGESKAIDIITYREAHGGFSDTKDIKNVSGIGNATFEKLKSKITVE